MAVEGASGAPPRARWSWLRELIPSLPKTLCRWYSTVRRLMNSRAPIAGLDGALADALARGHQLAPGPLRERLHPHLGEQVVGGPQLLARVEAPVLAAEPFAIEQVGACELHADARAAE